MQEAEREAAEQGAAGLVSRLSQLLSSMKDWERRPLLKAGSVVVEVVKLPRRETKRGVEPERLVIHIRREDSFRGIIIDGLREFEDLLEAVRSEKVQEVARAIDEVNRSRRVVEFSL